MKVPKLLSKPWATKGLKNDIPADRSEGLPIESATYNEGFPSITMTPISTGGKAPSGKDMNGVLNELSDHIVYQNKGSLYPFDSAFAEKIGGYPKGAVLINDNLNLAFQSLIDNNKTNFNTQNYADKWVVVFGNEFFVPKTQKASTTQAGIVQLSNDDNSDDETKAPTLKVIKKLKGLYDGLRSLLNNYIPNSKKSNAVNSPSSDTVATSQAVKTAYDKAESKWTKQSASDTQEGVVQLSHKTDGTDQTKAASEFALGEVGKKSLPVGAVIAFPRAVEHPVGFLKCDGSTFTQQTYPDLYRTLGNRNTLPNLTRSDVGQLAYFPSDTIPEGWLACDGQVISQTDYPVLYAYLGSRYGANGKLPNAEDRFIRNAGNGLRVGQTQGDAIRNITGNYLVYINDEASPPSGVFQILEDRFGGIGYAPRGRSKTMSFDSSRVVPTADENRPKSIVFVLCIKAWNRFDDVQFWIKAFGEVSNVGQLDASRLGQDIQQIRAEKADLYHQHNVADIRDFSQGVANEFFYQKIGDFEIRRYPDGTMIQTCIHRRSGLEFSRNYDDSKDFVTLVHPIAFVSKPVVSITPELSHPYLDGNQAVNDKTKRLSSPINESDDGNWGLTIDNNQRQCQFNYQNPNVYISEMSFHIFVIGRWK